MLNRNKLLDADLSLNIQRLEITNSYLYFFGNNIIISNKGAWIIPTYPSV